MCSNPTPSPDGLGGAVWRNMDFGLAIEPPGDISLGIAEPEWLWRAEEDIMSNSFMGDGFGGRRGGGGEGWPGSAVWDAMEQLRGQFDRKVGTRMGRGDVRAAVLALLAEKPMHGYQIIQELSARSGGAWSPSPGSVYPTLQLLADEGLIIAEETAGKKVFSLTETGAALVAETADQPAPWEDAAQGNSDASNFREAAGKLMPALFQIGKNGTPAQIEAAAEVVNDARKKLYAILAED